MNKYYSWSMTLHNFVSAVCREREGSTVGTEWLTSTCHRTPPRKNSGEMAEQILLISWAAQWWFRQAGTEGGNSLETNSLSRTHRKCGWRRIQQYRRVEDRIRNSKSRPSTSWRQSRRNRFVRKYRLEALYWNNICYGTNLETEEFITPLEDKARTMV